MQMCVVAQQQWQQRVVRDWGVLMLRNCATRQQLRWYKCVCVQAEWCVE